MPKDSPRTFKSRFSPEKAAATAAGETSIGANTKFCPPWNPLSHTSASIHTYTNDQVESIMDLLSELHPIHFARIMNMLEASQCSFWQAIKDDEIERVPLVPELAKYHAPCESVIARALGAEKALPKGKVTWISDDALLSFDPNDIISPEDSDANSIRAFNLGKPLRNADGKLGCQCGEKMKYQPGRFYGGSKVLSAARFSCVKGECRMSTTDTAVRELIPTLEAHNLTAIPAGFCEKHPSAAFQVKYAKADDEATGQLMVRCAHFGTGADRFCPTPNLLFMEPEALHPFSLSFVKLLHLFKTINGQ